MMLYWITRWTALTYSPVFCDYIMKLLIQIGHERDTIAGGGGKKPLEDFMLRNQYCFSQFTLAWFHWQLQMGVTAGQMSGRQPWENCAPSPFLQPWDQCCCMPRVGRKPLALLHPNSISITSSVCLNRGMGHHPSQTRKAALLEAHWGPAVVCTGGKQPMAPKGTCLCEQAVDDDTGLGMSLKPKSYWAFPKLSDEQTWCASESSHFNIKDSCN